MFTSHSDAYSPAFSPRGRWPTELGRSAHSVGCNSLSREMLWRDLLQARQKSLLTTAIAVSIFMHCDNWKTKSKTWAPSSGNSREGWVPDLSAKISTHRIILKNAIKQSNHKDFEQGSMLPMKNFCPLKFQVRSYCHTSARPAYCPLDLPGSCKAALMTPAWLSRTGTGKQLPADWVSVKIG